MQVIAAMPCHAMPENHTELQKQTDSDCSLAWLAFLFVGYKVLF